MATRGAGRTAYGAAFMKAMEAFAPAKQRLFEDPATLWMLPRVARVLLRTGPLRRALLRFAERSAPGLYGGMVCRTRAIDDALRAALPCEVVILGAGLDSRPYRMSELASTRVVEVDQPAIIAAKQKAARRFGARVEYVAIDFETERLEDKVELRGKTFFIWEGVTQYIARAAVDAVLRWVARAPRGSELVFTYVPLEVIEGRSTLLGIEAAKSASKRAPWLTGFEPAQLSEELGRFGLELCEDLGAAEHSARYLTPIGRALQVFGIERVARARVR
jgi:methyltransferase (TIGR00027 family)